MVFRHRKTIAILSISLNIDEPISPRLISYFGVPDDCSSTRARCFYHLVHLNIPDITPTQFICDLCHAISWQIIT